MSQVTGSLLIEVLRALDMTQTEFARFLGVSRRTIQRLDHQLMRLRADQRMQLIDLLYPKDPELAARMAQGITATGAHLEALRAAAVRHADPRAADVAIYAVADVLDMPPRAVRAGLLAGLRRAREQGLSLEALIGALEQGVRTDATADPGAKS